MLARQVPLLGIGGAGKSTMAAMLERGGMALVGDDLIALAVGDAEGAPGGKIGLHRSLPVSHTHQSLPLKQKAATPLVAVALSTNALAMSLLLLCL